MKPSFVIFGLTPFDDVLHPTRCVLGQQIVSLRILYYCNGSPDDSFVLTQKVLVRRGPEKQNIRPESILISWSANHRRVSTFAIPAGYQMFFCCWNTAIGRCCCCVFRVGGMSRRRTIRNDEQ
jgi:hypothetical protein